MSIQAVRTQLDLAKIHTSKHTPKERLYDVWQVAMGMELGEISSSAHTFAALNVIAGSEDEPESRRIMAGTLLKEVFVRSERAQQDTILHTAQLMRKTPALRDTARAIMRLG